MVADLISVEEAYGQDPVTGEIDMDKFRQFAAQQEQILANKPPASREMQYLAANPDVMQNAKEELAKASRDNERLRTKPIGATNFIENVAREHYLNFGKQEGREGFCIIDPRMKNFANIMANTYDAETGSGEDIVIKPTFNTGANTIEDFAKYTSGINQNLYDRLIDRFQGDTNEDKAPGRVDEVLQFMFTPNTSGNTGFEIFGGSESLAQAYDQLGVTGEGESYADKQVRDLLNLVKKYEIDTTSLDLGDVGDRAVTQEFSGPNAFQDATSAFMNSIGSVPPLGVLGMLGLAGKVASNFGKYGATDAETKLRYAINEAFGFGPGGPGDTRDSSISLSGTYGNLGETDRSLVD